jgi:transforming growth factor-beta-induced protein
LKEFFMLWNASLVCALNIALAATIVCAQESPRHVQFTLAPVAATKATSDQARKLDIVETVEKARSLQRLAAAIDVAELAKTLKGKGPYTLFAPTDKAFSKLPNRTVEDLLKPRNKEKLKAILLQHVVLGNLLAAEIAQQTETETIDGQSLAIKKHTDHVTVNEAKITKTDIVCGNGVIHVIDTVLMPKASQK